MSEARFIGNLADGHLALTKQALCAVDAAPDQVLMRRHPDSFAEEALEMRDAQTRDCGYVGERYVLTQVVFDIGENFSKSASRHSSNRLARVVRNRGNGAMTTHQPRRNGHRKAIEVQLAGWIAALHFGFDCPTDAFQLSVAYLKAILYFHSSGINIQLFRYDVEDLRRNTQREVSVFLFDFPHARRAGGNDFDVAVHYGASMSGTVPPAGGPNGCSDVNRDDRISQRGNLDLAGGVAQQSHPKARAPRRPIISGPKHIRRLLNSSRRELSAHRDNHLWN